MGARALGRRPWKRIGTLFAIIYKRVLSRNLDKVYALKYSTYFGGRLSVGGRALEPPFAFRRPAVCPPAPALLLSLTITTLSSSFLAINAFYHPQKKNKITAVIFLLLLLSHFCTYFSLQTL